ncbi:Uncharacterised protein [Mycobacteroides abscessus subsp. abscessus]|nr:Uncharacterised protein [Mycobacteroides abscessus subsp. abscessus]
MHDRCSDRRRGAHPDRTSKWRVGRHPSRRPLGACTRSTRRTYRDRPRDHRRRHVGLREPTFRAGGKHRTHSGAGRGVADNGPRNHGHPGVRVQSAGPGDGRGRSDLRTARRRRGGRSRVDEPRPDGYGGAQRGESAGNRPRPVRRRPFQSGHRGRRGRTTLGTEPHSTRRVRAPVTRTRRRSNRFGCIRRSARYVARCARG